MFFILLNFILFLLFATRIYGKGKNNIYRFISLALISKKEGEYYIELDEAYNASDIKLILPILFAKRNKDKILIVKVNVKEIGIAIEKNIELSV